MCEAADSKTLFDKRFWKLIQTHAGLKIQPMTVIPEHPGETLQPNALAFLICG